MKDSLAPYPTPSKNQERLVRETELIANFIKNITHIAALPFSPLFKFKNKMAQKKWPERAQAVPMNELIQPEQSTVYVTNRTQAMDHNFFYTLKKGRIWYKPIAAPRQSPWLLFGPDGRPPNNTKLTGISSDGRNLVAIDESEFVYYIQTDKINFFVTNEGWKIKEINLMWQKKWFAMPLVNHFMGEKILKLPKNCIAFAISQKGPETGYYTDMNGKNQPEFLVGVTTLFALCNDGRIFFADPWLGSGFCNEITAPEDGQFVAENMAAAASAIFLIRRDETGRACMYTRFADFDSIGSDRFLPASHNPYNRLPLVRRLPAEDWIKQPDIPLTGGAQITSQIAVLQTGRGQPNRQLRVEGTNANGLPGYYFKWIYEKTWHFEPTPDQTLVFKNSPQFRNAPPPPVDLDGQIYTRKGNSPFKTVALKKFLHHGLNERGLHTMVELTLNNGRKLMIPLYARLGIAHIFGQQQNLPHWQLVMPKEYEYDHDPEVKAALKLIFHHKSKVSVSVNELENGGIEIFNKHKRFVLEFNETKPCMTKYYAQNRGLTMFDNRPHNQYAQPIKNAFSQRPTPSY